LQINGTPQILFRNPANPANPGEVTFTATIGGGTTPTGHVLFYDDDALLTPPPGKTVASGNATFTYSQFTIGKHRVFAVYSGDSKNGGSVSAEYEIYRDPKTR
jgi:hypothetical protein